MVVEVIYVVRHGVSAVPALFAFHMDAPFAMRHSSPPLRTTYSQRICQLESILANLETDNAYR